MPRGENLKRIPPEERAKWLGLKPLPPGWKGGNVYIRAPEEVFALFAGLTTQQRGEVVRAGLMALGFLSEEGLYGQKAGE